MRATSRISLHVVTAVTHCSCAFVSLEPWPSRKGCDRSPSLWCLIARSGEAQVALRMLRWWCHQGPSCDSHLAHNSHWGRGTWCHDVMVLSSMCWAISRLWTSARHRLAWLNSWLNVGFNLDSTMGHWVDALRGLGSISEPVTWRWLIASDTGASSNP